MGGEIGVDSNPGQGSRFWFAIRLDAVEAPPVATVIPHPTLLRGRKVIVIDDTEINRRAIAGQLASLGIEASVFEHPQEFLAAMYSAAVEGVPFDVAILDERMPTVMGGDLARQIRTRSALDATKLILATSNSMPNPSEATRRAGFNAFVVKPLTRSALTTALCKVLDISFGAVPTGRPRWAPSPDPTETRTVRILVAEDNDINQAIIEAMLTGMGCEATLVSNGHEAVFAALSGDYDLILMDLQMPGMSGVQATAAIRASSGRRGEVPIVALTAHAMAEVHGEILEAGMQDLVSKPIEPAALTLAVRRWTATVAHEAIQDVIRGDINVG